MAKSNSWKTASVISVTVKGITQNSYSDDFWKVDRFPSKQTRCIRVSYGVQTVVKRYGKK